MTNPEQRQESGETVWTELLGIFLTALLDAELNLRRAVEDSLTWDWKPAALTCANRMQQLAQTLTQDAEPPKEMWGEYMQRMQEFNRIGPSNG